MGMTRTADIEARHGRTWVICPDLAIGVAAYRRVDLSAHDLGPAGLNVLMAGTLDELDEKLTEQDRITPGVASGHGGSTTRP